MPPIGKQPPERAAYVPPEPFSDNYKPGEFTQGTSTPDRQWQPGDFTGPAAPAWATGSGRSTVKPYDGYTDTANITGLLPDKAGTTYKGG